MQDSQQSDSPSERRWMQWMVTWPAMCLGLFLVLVFLNGALLLGRAAPIWDADGQAVAFQSMVSDYARQGRLLGWNPWSEGGSPDFAEPQFGALSPLAVGVGACLGPGLWGYNVYWVLWQLLSGCGMLLLARSLKARPWVGFIVALAWVFSGVLMTDSEHLPYLIGYYSLPWIIWRLDVGLREGRFWPFIEAGALWGFSALSGYPGIVMMNACFAALWALGRLLSGKATPEGKVASLGVRAWTRGASAMVILGVVGALVLSPTYFGFLHEMKGFSTRSGAISFDTAVQSGAMHPGVLSCFASPYLPLLKGYNAHTLWDYTDVSGCGLYVCALVVSLALVSLWIPFEDRPRNRWRWWLVGIGLLAMGLCLSRTLPLRGWLYDVFFPARYFRNAVNFRVYGVFVLLILGLEGARDLIDKPQSVLKKLVLVGAAVGVIALSVFTFMMLIVEKHGAGVEYAIVHAVIVWLATPLLAWLMLRPGVPIWWVMPVGFVALILVDVVGARGLPDMIIETQKPGMMAVWRQMEEHHSSNLDLTANGLNRVVVAHIPEPPNCKNLMVKLPSLVGYTALSNPYTTAMAQDPQVASMVCGSDRIWFSPIAVESGVQSGDFKTFLGRAHDLKALPAVIHPRPLMLAMVAPDAETTTQPTAPVGAAPAAIHVPFKVDRYLPEELSLTVQCPSAGWLFVTDRWSQSWEATVNGKPTPVLGGAFIFRAIQVETGENHVEFRFEPAGMPWLVVLSWGVLAIVGMGSVWLVVKGLRSHKRYSVVGVPN